LLSLLSPAVLRVLILAYLLPVLLVLAVVMPPWENPDEPFHMLRAVHLAHGGVLGYRAWGSAGGASDPAIYDAYKPVIPVSMHAEQRVSRAALAASGAVGWRHETIYTPFPNTAQYFPAFYVPDAAAYWIGRATRLSVDRTLILARCMNAVVYALIAAVVLTLARRARPFLAAVLLLPTSLELAASASQDCGLLAATALVVAVLDRAMAEQRATSGRETLLVAVLLTCIGAARPPYAGFLLLLFLTALPPRRAPVRLAAMCGALILAWCLAVAWRVSIKFGGADIHQQVALLAGDPGRIPGIVVATLRTFTVDYVVQIIGVLGWTDTRLPHGYVIAGAAVLVLALAASADGPVRRPGWALGAVAFALAALFVLQYLTWTWPGQPYVTGVFGRYFLPMMMVFALGVPRVGLSLRVPAGVAIAGLACITPAVMLHAILLRYYVQ
jgi:uncharacterized membrane protein